jgi:predicted dehydrogenase
MRFLDRREFLKNSSAVAAALASAASLDGVLRADEKEKETKSDSPSERLNVAIIGVNGRGMNHVTGFAGKHNCVVKVICDVDSKLAEREKNNPLKTAEEKQGVTPKFETDIRKVLEDKSIDIVSIATPNHWHALGAIWAMQAGKDVYVEKPVSHNVSEGRRIVEVARKLNKICQTGTQSRSGRGLREAIAFMHEGHIGKVKLARGLCYKPRGSIGKVDRPQPIPASVDYDLWCGPAMNKPLMRKNLHYDWHWTWEYGNGDLGNQGIHEMDKARWGLGKNSLPNSAMSVGGRFGYVDDGETANTQICVFDYGDCQLIFEVRGLASKSPYPFEFEAKYPYVGNVWYGTEGVVVCPNYSSAVVFSPKGEVIKKFSGGEDHFGNFVKAVRSRKREDLNADIEEGHLSSALCHLGNISYRLGELAPFDKKRNAFGDNKEAAETFESMMDHLDERKVPLDATKYHLGLKLAIDPKSETFVSNRAANAMLTREYRKGFEVPAKV